MVRATHGSERASRPTRPVANWSRLVSPMIIALTPQPGDGRGVLIRIE